MKTLRKTNFVLALISYGRFGPLVESLVKLQGRSLKFGKLTDLVPGVFKSEKFKIKPHTIHPWHVIPLETKLENAKTQPLTFPKFHKWSL